MVHNVYFWIKDGTSEKNILAFEKALEKLGTVSSLQTYYWGKPAPTEQREVIDHSYQYSINAFFETIDDHNAYQVDPIHNDFVQNHSSIWEKVQVYDNLTKSQA